MIEIEAGKCPHHIRIPLVPGVLGGGMGHTELVGYLEIFVNRGNASVC
jgi:hypothetical protein